MAETREQATTSVNKAIIAIVFAAILGFIIGEIGGYSHGYVDGLKEFRSVQNGSIRLEKGQSR